MKMSIEHIAFFIIIGRCDRIKFNGLGNIFLLCLRFKIIPKSLGIMVYCLTYTGQKACLRPSQSAALLLNTSLELPFSDEWFGNETLKLRTMWSLDSSSGHSAMLENISGAFVNTRSSMFPLTLDATVLSCWNENWFITSQNIDCDVMLLE